LTYQEAALRLGCPVGTLGVRLARGRELLRARLTRRGSILPAGLRVVGAVPTAAPTALPPALVNATVQAAIRGVGGKAMTAGLVSASVLSLSDGVLRNMLMTRVKTAALALLSAGIIMTGGGLLLRQAAARQGGRQAAGGRGAATIPAKDPLRDGVARGAGMSDAERSRRSEERAQRVRELIYYFRDYRVFSRDEEWARTIRELAAIGKDAVPELVAELDRTDRDATIRSLAFTLRAIGDPRAVPALIRAIPKALRPPGSDCGVTIVDPDLRAFMLAHQNHKAKYVAIGRPVNEIITAIEKITQHREPPDVGERDPLRLVFLRGTPEEQARQRAMFEQRRNLWEAWWSGHLRQFVTPEELRSVELPRRDQDLVAMAGLARYGPLFPTGPGMRLGPVRMLRLTQAGYANGRSHLDFDTGRVFSQYEGMKAADWDQRDDFGSRITTWYRRSGIDVCCQGSVDGVDLLLWLVDDSRWDTLETEIRKGGPLPLGREATSSLVRFEKTWVDFQSDKLATFLFTTREGGRGIVQVFPKDKHADGYRLRYRMWLTSPEEPTVARPLAGSRRAREPGTPFGSIVTTTLGSPAGERESVLDFETDRRAVPPEDLKPNTMTAASSLPYNRSFTRWCRDQGIDVFGFMVPAGREVEAAREPAPAKAVGQPVSQSVSGLIGLDMIEARILPETFDEVTVEEAHEILGRMPPDRSGVAWMMIGDDLAERPDTFAFRTREGIVGLLQIEAGGKEERSLTLRYRLERRD
jgi:hypothetical protein